MFFHLVKYISEAPEPQITHYSTHSLVLQNLKSYTTKISPFHTCKKFSYYDK
jgi:hypothetical protein